MDREMKEVFVKMGCWAVYIILLALLIIKFIAYVYG
jgi:hypothetical protein